MDAQCLCIMHSTQFLPVDWRSHHESLPSVRFMSAHVRLMHTSVAADKLSLITQAGRKRMAAVCLTSCAISMTMHAVNQPDPASIHCIGHLQPMSKQSL